MSIDARHGKVVLVIAPHPDDETLGCGGTILAHKRKGDRVHWLIVTNMSESAGYSQARIDLRRAEIKQVADRYGFEAVHDLGLPPAHLDDLAMSDIVGEFGKVFSSVSPQVVYLPYRGDIHTDHRIVFDAATACIKWFRYPSVSRVLAYETLSETDFSVDPDISGFRPNVFSNIGVDLEEKINIASIYKSEMAEFPFPRSEVALRALAQLRGAASGFHAAEAFILLREKIE